MLQWQPQEQRQLIPELEQEQFHDMKDLLLNNYGDLDVSTLDIRIGISDLQHQEHIIVAQKGSLKRYPDRGVGIVDFVNDSEIDALTSDVRAEFEKDGMTVEKVNYSEDTTNLEYEAHY